MSAWEPLGTDGPVYHENTILYNTINVCYIWIHLGLHNFLYLNTFEYTTSFILRRGNMSLSRQLAVQIHMWKCKKKSQYSLETFPFHALQLNIQLKLSTFTLTNYSWLMCEIITLTGQSGCLVSVFTTLTNISGYYI